MVGHHAEGSTYNHTHCIWPSRYMCVCECVCVCVCVSSALLIRVCHSFSPLSGLVRWNRTADIIETVLRHDPSYLFTAMIDQDSTTGRVALLDPTQIAIIQRYDNGTYNITQLPDVMNATDAKGIAIQGNLIYLASRILSTQLTVFNLSSNTYLDLNAPHSTCNGDPSLHILRDVGEIIYFCDLTNEFRSFNLSNIYQSPTTMYLPNSCQIQDVARASSGGAYLVSCYDGSLHQLNGTGSIDLFAGAASCSTLMSAAITWVDAISTLVVPCFGDLRLVSGGEWIAITNPFTICNQAGWVVYDADDESYILACYRVGLYAIRGRDSASVLTYRNCVELLGSVSIGGDRLIALCKQAGSEQLLSVSGSVATPIAIHGIPETHQLKKLIGSDTNPSDMYLLVSNQDSSRSGLYHLNLTTGVASNISIPVETIPWILDVALMTDGSTILTAMVGTPLTFNIYRRPPEGDTFYLLSNATGIQATIIPYTLVGELYILHSQLGLMHATIDNQNPNQPANLTVLVPSTVCAPAGIDGDESTRLLYIVCFEVGIMVYNVASHLYHFLTAPVDSFGGPIRLFDRFILTQLTGPAIQVIDRETLLTWQIPLGITASISDIRIDHFSGVPYVACMSGLILAVSSSFRCNSGSAWSVGGCEPCQTGSASPVISRTSVARGVCTSCDIGSVAPFVGSAQCDMCASGTFYNLTLNAQFCTPCSAGYAQPNTGATACDTCTPGRYTSDILSSQCRLCEAGKYADHNGSTICIPCGLNSASDIIGLTHACDLCPPGSDQPNPGERECESCDIGAYSSSGSVCSTCPVDTYAPGLSAAKCITCKAESQAGLSCRNGIASVLADWWPYESYDESIGDTIYLTAACPRGFCPGSILTLNSSANGNSSQLSSPLCLYPRVDSPSNWLCGECESGYVAWGDRCALCESANGGLIFGLIVLCFVIVLFLLRAGSSSAGELSILLFFTQIASLQFSSIIESIGWLRFANLSSQSTKSCLAPLTPIEQYVLTFFTPLILAAALAIIGVTHLALARMRTSNSTHPRLQRLSALMRLSLSPDRYIGCLISIFLFSFTSVAQSVIESLHCVELAPGVDRLFTQPTVDCHSDEYRHFLVLVWIWLIAFVIGGPIAMFVFLRSNRHRLDVTNANILLSESTDGGVVGGSSFAIADPPLTPFELRWGPLYRGYTSSSWYWTPLTLLRRIALVLVSVFATPSSMRQFVFFSTIHSITLLLHMHARPFTTNRLNQVEKASYIILIALSNLLAAESTYDSSSYPLWVEVLVAVVVLPSVAAMAVWTIRHHVTRLKERLNGGNQANHPPSSSPSASSYAPSSDTDLNSIRANRHSVFNAPTVEESRVHRPSVTAADAPSRDMELKERLLEL